MSHIRGTEVTHFLRIASFSSISVGVRDPPTTALAAVTLDAGCPVVAWPVVLVAVSYVDEFARARSRSFNIDTGWCGEWLLGDMSEALTNALAGLIFAPDGGDMGEAMVVVKGGGGSCGDREGEDEGCADEQGGVEEELHFDEEEEKEMELAGREEILV